LTPLPPIPPRGRPHPSRPLRRPRRRALATAARISRGVASESSEPPRPQPRLVPDSGSPSRLAPPAGGRDRAAGDAAGPRRSRRGG